MDKDSLYRYEAVVNRIVDGDTVNITIDLGFRTSMTANCRLAFINAWELSSKIEQDKTRAYEAKNFLMKALPASTKILIRSRSLDKYGRPIVEVFLKSGDFKSLNTLLIEQGLVKLYEG